MKRWNDRAVISCGCVVLCATGLSAQGRGGADWTTSGSDAQRSSWVRTDPKISPAGFSKPGFGLAWKVKVSNDPRQLNSLTSAVLLDRYIGYRGFRSLAFLGGSGDNIVALDTDLGRIEWKKRLEGAPPLHNASLACPGGLTSSLTRPTGTEYPTAMTGRGGGRGGPAKSAAGAAGEGAVTIQQVAANAMGGNRGGFPGAPDAGRRGGAAAGFPRRMPQLVYALSSDGKLHAMYVSNGEEPAAPIAFLPANASVSGLIVVNDVAYAATSNGCGGAPNGLWALDMESKQVASWKTKGNITGAEGFSFAPDGTIFAATDAGELAALEPKTLKVLAQYNSGGQGFASSPVVFDYKEKTLVAVSTTDGSIHMLTPALGQAVAKTPASPGAVDAAALASWQEADGTRWLLAPGATAVTTWKVAGDAGSPALQAGWTSRDLVAPAPPMVINGVVFALSSGEAKGAKDAKTAAQRSSHAVLYAFDGKSGKELWNSGITITGFAHSGGLSAGGSQLYVETYDGTLYAFGYPIEH